jgi:hypothetical protein
VVSRMFIDDEIYLVNRFGACLLHHLRHWGGDMPNRFRFLFRSHMYPWTTITVPDTLREWSCVILGWITCDCLKEIFLEAQLSSRWYSISKRCAMFQTVT